MYYILYKNDLWVDFYNEYSYRYEFIVQNNITKEYELITNIDNVFDINQSLDELIRIHNLTDIVAIKEKYELTEKNIQLLVWEYMPK